MLVAPFVRSVERSLGPGVVANRARTVDSTLRPVMVARARWRRIVSRVLTRGSFAIVSDVRDCYASIGVTAVGAGLARAGATSPDDLATFLRGLPARGLPVGPEPSAVLANAVLAIADDAAAATGVAVVRWVDDVLLVGADRASVLGAFDAWRSHLAALGLVPNGAKTAVAGGERTRERLLGMRPSGVEGSAHGIIRTP